MINDDTRSYEAWTLASLYALCQKAHLQPHELDVNVMLCLLWLLLAFSNRDFEFISQMIQLIVYNRDAPGDVPLSKLQPQLRQSLLELQPILLDRSDWNIYLDLDRHLQPALMELEAFSEFPQLCFHIHLQAKRCGNGALAPLAFPFSGNGGGSVMKPSYKQQNGYQQLLDSTGNFPLAKRRNITPTLEQQHAAPTLHSFNPYNHQQQQQQQHYFEENTTRKNNKTSFLGRGGLQKLNPCKYPSWFRSNEGTAPLPQTKNMDQLEGWDDDFLHSNGIGGGDDGILRLRKKRSNTSEE